MLHVLMVGLFISNALAAASWSDGFCGDIAGIPIASITKEQERSIFTHYQAEVDFQKAVAHSPEIYPGISADQQRKYLNKVENKLIEQYERLIPWYIYVLKKYPLAGDRAKKMHYAALSLLQNAIRNYDNEKARFSTYYVAILDKALYANWTRTLAEDHLWNRGQLGRLQEYEREFQNLAAESNPKYKPNETEVLDYYIPVGDTKRRQNMEELLEKRRFWERAGEWENPRHIVDHLIGDGITSAIDQEMFKALEEAIESLDPRERKIINMRFKKKLTLKLVGIEMGVTKERIRQLQSRAEKKIREYMQGRGFFSL